MIKPLLTRNACFDHSQRDLFHRHYINVVEQTWWLNLVILRVQEIQSLQQLVLQKAL